MAWWQWAESGHGPRGRLPVLQLLSYSLGDAAAEQPQDEEDGHAHADGRQQVRLRGGRHHLHGQVRQAVGRRHLEDKRHGVVRRV